MRLVLMLSLVLMSTSLFAKERITTSGKAEITCPANLSCTLSFSEANDLYKAAAQDALNKFSNLCSKPDHRNAVSTNNETKVECSQTKSKVTCSAIMQNDCELEYVQPYYM